MSGSELSQVEQVELIKNEYSGEIESMRQNMFDVYMHYAELNDRGKEYDLANAIYKYVDHNLEVMGGKDEDPHSDRAKKLNIGQNNLVMDLKNVERNMRELQDMCQGERFTQKRIAGYSTVNEGERLTMAVQRAIEIISQLAKQVSEDKRIDEKGKVSFFDTI